MTKMTIRAVAAIAASLIIALGSRLAASARPDPGNTVRFDAPCQGGQCPLRRIGRQLVRGDFLTGAGVPAPLGVPELRIG